MHGEPKLPKPGAVAAVHYGECEGCGGVGELQRIGVESSGVGGGFYRLGAGLRWEWCRRARELAIGGQCGGATDGNAVRARRKRNGAGEGHVVAQKLVVYDARRAFDRK